MPGRWKVYFRQRPIKGGRLHLTSSCEEGIRKAVEREARRYGVSMSFVMSVALADQLGVSLKFAEDYRDIQRTRESRAPRKTDESETAVH
jgi:hypothetical protein